VDPEGQRARRLGQALTVLLLVAVAVIYAPSLRAGFTTWDDADAVLRNTAVRTLAEGSAGERLKSALGLFHPARLRLGDYAPVAQISLAVDLGRGGGDPAPFHATHLIVHLLSVLLVIGIARRLGAGPYAAVIAGALFAVHPVQAEPVSWISCRGRMLASLFGLLALRSQLAPSPRAGWAAFWLGMGVLSKVSILAWFPPVLVAGVVGGRAVRTQRAVLGVTVAAVAVLLLSRLGPAAPETVDVGRVLLVPDGVARYLHILVVPNAASVFHALDGLGDGLAWGTLPGALLVGVLVLLAPSRTRRVAGSLLVGCALLYLPNVVARSGISPVADRYLTDALAALAWLAATARLPAVTGVRVGAAAAAVLVALALVPSTRARQGYWGDAAVLWADAASKYPAHPFVWLQLGVAEETAGNYEGAAEAYRAHLERNPRSVAGLNNLASALAHQGQGEDALPLLARALELDGDAGPVWFNRGEILHALGRREEALKTFQRAVEIQPRLAEAQNAIGALLMEEGRLTEAQEALEAAIRARPDRPNAHYNLAMLLARRDHLPQAAHHYREAIRLRPGYRRAYNNLGLVYLRMGQVREAIRQLEHVVEIDPGYEDARINLGRAYLNLALREWGDVAEASPERTRLREQIRRLRECGTPQPAEARNGDQGEGDEEPAQ
jgi:tetratricopeptide (TPR) repeat protein/uncharacterized membrane protein YphA (DoxX/SURF4 family)